ncbi:LysR family transcriptional regulator [Chitinibacteraceae bacterium HSL-7]
MSADLPNWGWFLRIAERGSISAAARELNLSPAALSMALKRLEGQLGVQLFQRSTRQLALTSEGEVWYRSASAAQQALDAGLDALRHRHGALAGPLRIAAPIDFGRQFVLDWIDAFVAQHPQVEPSLQLSDSMDDLIAGSIDVALRYGKPQDSALVAIALAPRNRRCIVASPAYWAVHGQPAVPEDLVGHPCLAFVLKDAPHTVWRFERDEEVQEVRVAPVRTSNDGAVVAEWARRGYGVACKSTLDVASDLKAGRLVQALSDWQCEAAPLYVVRHGGRLQPARVRAFISFCADQL